MITKNAEVIEHYNAGIYHDEIGEYGYAINHYKNALKINPNFYEAWYNMGLSHIDIARGADKEEIRKDKYALAIEALEEAIKINPQDPDGWNGLGIALEGKKEYAKALSAYQKAIEIKPNFYQAWWNMATMFDKIGNYSEAIKSYRKVVEYINQENIDKKKFREMFSRFSKLKQYEGKDLIKKLKDKAPKKFV